METPHYLVATDLSRASRTAADAAAALAAATGARLHFFCAVPEEVVEDQPDAVERARYALGLFAAQYDVPGKEALFRAAATSDVAAAIVKRAKAVGADLIVTAPRGAGGWRKLVLGSVTSRVVRLAPAELLVARGKPRPGAPRMLVALDRSPGSARALRTALALAAQTGAELTALQVVPRPAHFLGLEGDGSRPLRGDARLSDRARRMLGELDEWIREFPGARARVKARVVEGPPAQRIVETAVEEGAWIVVLGTSGKSRPRELFVGSVARTVATAAPMSVLLVRARPPRRERRAPPGRAAAAAGPRSQRRPAAGR